MYTPGGRDRRWHPHVILEEGMEWVGGLMYAKLNVLCYLFFQRFFLSQGHRTTVPL